LNLLNILNLNKLEAETQQSTIKKESIPILHEIQYNNSNNLNNNLIKKGIEKLKKIVSDLNY